MGTKHWIYRKESARGALLVLALVATGCTRQFVGPPGGGTHSSVQPIIRQDATPSPGGHSISEVHHEDCRKRIGSSLASCVLPLDEGACDTCQIASEAASVITPALETAFANVLPSARAANHLGARLPQYPALPAQAFCTLASSSKGRSCAPLALLSSTTADKAWGIVVDDDAAAPAPNPVPAQEEVAPLFSAPASVAFDNVEKQQVTSTGLVCLYRKPSQGTIACTSVPSRHHLRVQLPPAPLPSVNGAR